MILGPTASGKTKMAVRLAHRLHTEIISVDSRQVYKELNIGVGKDYDSYVVDQQSIPVHLLDIVSLDQQYNIHLFVKDACAVFETLRSRCIPIFCGGSGLYIQQLIDHMPYSSIATDMELRADLQHLSTTELKKMYMSLDPPKDFKPDFSTSKRAIRAVEIAVLLQRGHVPEAVPTTHIQPFIVGIDLDVNARDLLIKQRLESRLQQGLVQEVEHLLDAGISPERLMQLGLEYEFTLKYLNKSYSYDQYVGHLYIAIRQFAKRQMTFFRSLEKKGITIHWVGPEDIHKVFEQVSKVFGPAGL